MAGVVGPWGSLDERLRGLERREQRQRRGEDFRGKWEFKVAPTCPPSTSIHVRGGQAWNPTDSWYPGRGWTVPNLTLDLADTAETYPGHTFTNAYYYFGAVLCLEDGYNPDYEASGLQELVLFTTDPATTERATSAEAEDDCLDILWNATNRPWDSTLPLAMVIIRNNGTTGTVCQYMPVDAVNRGRSYIFQDIRPRGLWVIGDI